MRIVAISCVRDEVDIIESFVRHTLCFAAQLVVLDNGSTDGTLAVLESLRDEGLPLEFVQDPSPGKYLSRRLTRLMHDVAIAKHKADWTVPLDADEFIIVPGSGGLIAADASEDAPIALAWRSYVPSSMDDPSQPNPVLRIRHRLVRENWDWLKVVVPTRLVAGTDGRIEQGSHGVVKEGRHIPPIHDGRALLGHLPIRSAGQFLAKTVVGHLQNQAMTDANPGWGWHHREQFQRLRADPSAFCAQFADVARRYSVPAGTATTTDIVDDPLPYRGGPLRHTPMMDEARHTWLPILNYAEDLARRYALLRASVAEGERDTLDRQELAFAQLRAQLHQQDQQLKSERAQIKQLQEQQQAAEASLEAATARHAIELERMAQALARHQEAEARLRAIQA